MQTFIWTDLFLYHRHARKREIQAYSFVAFRTIDQTEEEEEEERVSVREARISFSYFFSFVQIRFHIEMNGELIKMVMRMKNDSYIMNDTI